MASKVREPRAAANGSAPCAPNPCLLNQRAFRALESMASGKRAGNAAANARGGSPQIAELKHQNETSQYPQGRTPSVMQSVTEGVLFRALTAKRLMNVKFMKSH